MTTGGDVWAIGEAYEPYVGRWSSGVAAEFVGWLSVESGRRWLDVGCGTGALTEAILTLAAPSGVEGVEPAEGFVAYARRRVGDPRVSFTVGHAGALPGPAAAFDAVVSGLVLNFVPDPLGAVREMSRVAVTGGVVGAYVWDYAGGMELIRAFWDSAVALDPAARELDEGVRFPLCAPERLRALFAEAGLTDVEVRAIDVPTPFPDFDDYWVPFLGGQGPAPGYVTSLPEERRSALRERLRSELQPGDGGVIALTARAWAVRGRCPD